MQVKTAIRAGPWEDELIVVVLDAMLPRQRMTNFHIPTSSWQNSSLAHAVATGQKVGMLGHDQRVTALPGHGSAPAVRQLSGTTHYSLNTF